MGDKLKQRDKGKKKEEKEEKEQKQQPKNEKKEKQEDPPQPKAQEPKEDIAEVVKKDTDKTGLTKRFERIKEKALSFGLSADDLDALLSVKSLKAPRALKSGFSFKNLDLDTIGRIGVKFFLLLMILVLMLSISFIIEWPFTQKEYIHAYFRMTDGDIVNEPCLVDWNDKILDMTRPPVDCKMCEGMSKVARVSKITPEMFEENWAYSSVPVVITDAMKNWTATETFSFNFFKEIYAEGSTALRNTEEKCQFFPYKTNFNTLAEVFNMSRERAELREGVKPWYIGWSNCDSGAANILRNHYTRPYFLPRVAESSKTDWIFMGSPGYGAHMHIDNVEKPSWQAQITGSKLWALEPPPECYHVCVPRIEVLVNPGDIIVLDTNRWYHSTLIKGKIMSITIGSEYD